MKRGIGFFINTFILVIIAAFFWARGSYEVANYLFIAAGVSTILMLVWWVLIWKNRKYN